jgi:hypothetical protein
MRRSGNTGFSPGDRPGPILAAALLFFSLTLPWGPSPAIAFYEAESGDGARSVEAVGSLRLTGAYLDAPDLPVLYANEKDWLASGVGRLILDGTLSPEIDFEVNAFLEVSRLPPLSLEGTFATAGSVSSPYRTPYLTWDFWEEDEGRGQLGLDRLVMSLHTPPVHVSLGRMPINYSVTNIFTPNDFFAPFSATAINKVYKPGVDALRVTRSLGRFSGLELVYAYGDGGDRDSSATIARWFGNLNDWDLELLAGSVWIDDRFGFAFSGDLLGAGVRGEISRNAPRSGPDPDFTSATLEVDYRWENSLYLTTELHYNGFGSTDSEDYPALFLNPRVLTGQVQNVGRDYLASSLTYEFKPLITGTAAVLLNIHDRSGILSPTLQISLGDESSLVAGAILPWGDGPTLTGLPSEYGAYPSSVWVQYRHYF